MNSPYMYTKDLPQKIVFKWSGTQEGSIFLDSGQSQGLFYIVCLVFQSHVFVSPEPKKEDLTFTSSPNRKFRFKF